MDVLYIYRRSTQEEVELRYSLRSVARYLPYIRKVWIFGDRPGFLCSHRLTVEHVRQEYTAGVGNHRLPVVNLFLQLFLGSLIPDLSPEFLLFADDYVLLDDVREDFMRKDRALEDLAARASANCSLSLREASGTRQLPGGIFRNSFPQRAGMTAAALPPGSLWREALWRTIDLLARLDLPVYNFEAHVPAFLTKARVLEAFCFFRDFITEDRLYGPLALTAILNLAAKNDPANVVLLGDERSRAGFYRPADLETIRAHCAGKKFLNFNEAGFNADLREFLEAEFSEPCGFEARRPRAHLATHFTNETFTEAQRPSVDPDSHLRVHR